MGMGSGWGDRFFFFFFFFFFFVFFLGGGGQDGCERRIEFFVKIQKTNRGGGGSGRVVDMNEELKLL